MVSKYRNFLKPQNKCQSKWTSTNKNMPAPHILSQHWFIAHIHNNSFVFPYRNVHFPSPKHGPPMVVHQTYSSFAIDAYCSFTEPKTEDYFLPKVGDVNIHICAFYMIYISLSLSPSPLPINISPLDLFFNFLKSPSFSMGSSVPGAAAWPVAPASATAPAPAPQRRRPGPRCPEGPGGLRASASWASGGSPGDVFS